MGKGIVLCWRLLCWLVPKVFWCLKWLFIGLKALIKWTIQHYQKPPTTHGSARFAVMKDIRQISGHTGLITGKFAGKFLRFSREGYMLVMAPTRTGKGEGIIIPNLLTYPGSWFLHRK